MSMLDVPGATLTYDVRRNDSTSEPILLKIASPMGRGRLRHALQALRRPNGRDLRSPRIRAECADRRCDAVHADEHADDLHRIISVLDAGPVDIFASSGGAVTHSFWSPGIPSRSGHSSRTSPGPHGAARSGRRSRCDPGRPPDVYAQWVRRGHDPLHCARQPQGRDTGRFRRSAGSRSRHLRTADRGRWHSQRAPFGAEHHCGVALRARLRRHSSAKTRIVLAAGSESEGEMANRGAHAVADRLGKSPVTFPSDHGGFLGGEYGQTGDPDAFAAKLRDTLTES
jgi:hypothetical protein